MLKPRDFLKNYSPENKAILYYHPVDERMIIEKNFFYKSVVNLFKPVISGLILLKRDAYLKKIKADIKNIYGAVNEESIKKYIKNIFSRDHLRKFEYVFQADCLLRHDIKKDIIADFGGGGSFSTYIPVLFKIPFKRLLSFDVMNIPLKSQYGIEYILADCTKTELPDNSVDLVMLISTLEHIGLGRYGDPLDVNGDINAVNEAYRILKKGGHIIITVPYGFPSVIYNLCRVYDKGRFNLISQKFKKVMLKYSLEGNMVPRIRAEGKKVSNKIKGYYNDDSSGSYRPEPRAGLMALLRKI